MQGQRFPKRKNGQMLLIASDKVKELPEVIQQYITQYFSTKMVDGKEYRFAFLCPQYESGDTGAAPKSTPKMISNGVVSWLMKNLSEGNKTFFTLFEANWFIS